MTQPDKEIVETCLSNVEAPEDKKKISFNFEIVLEHIGQMGKYQALLAIFILYLAIPVGMDSLGTIFLLAIPSHRCHLPGIDANPKYTNFSQQDLLNLSTPLSAEEYGGCKMYDYNYTRCLDEMSMDCSQAMSNSSIVSCQSYVYSEAEFGHTVVSEWDLVCDRLILGTTLNSVYYAGAMVGCLLSGNISDNFGRRYVMLIGTFVTIGFGIASAFAPTLVFFGAMRFLFALSSTGTFAVGFVYVTEILGQKWRDIVGPLYNSTFAIGYTALSAMALYWRSWRQLQLGMALCSAPFFLMCILIPESPRWFFAKCRNNEGKKVSHMIAKRNGSPLPYDIWTKSLQKTKSEDQAENKRSYSVVTLYQSRGIRRVTFIMMFVYFTTSSTYFGLSLNVGALTGDLYTNNALSGIAEILAGPAAMITLHRFGRRLSTCMTLVAAGSLSIASSMANEFSYGSTAIGLIGTSSALCGKLAISTTYNVIFLYITELYPTVVRATAFSTATTSSLAASIITPYTLYLQYYFSWLPGIIFGTLSILAGLLSLRLKETRHHQMMTSILEAERFYEA